MTGRILPTTRFALGWEIRRFSIRIRRISCSCCGVWHERCRERRPEVS